MIISNGRLGAGRVGPASGKTSNDKTSQSQESAEEFQRTGVSVESSIIGEQRLQRVKSAITVTRIVPKSFPGLGTKKLTSKTYCLK